MARVPYLSRRDLAAEDQDLLVRDINLFRALAHAPEAARPFLRLAQHIRSESRVDPRLRELAIIQVGYSAASSYEYSHHVKIGRDYGVSEADLEALVAESEGRASLLEPVAKAVVKAAREMTLDGTISETSFRELGRHLDKPQLVELVMIIGFYVGVVSILASLEIDVEDEYKRYVMAPPNGERDHGSTTR